MPKFAQIFLDGLETQDVQNKADLSIDLNFDRNGNYSQQATITSYEFVLEANKKIIEQATSLANNNVGVFEGMPLKIVVENDNIFDGYLDLSNEAEFGREVSTIKAIDKKNIDWLNDTADGFSFQTLYQNGVLLPSDMIAVPYVINAIPNYKDAAIMVISVYSLSVQLSNSITDITMLGIEMANPFEATAIIRMIIYVTQLILLLAALVKVVIQLINLLIQKIKYHSGCYTKTLLQRGCQYLGLNFNSTIFNSGDFENDFFIPEKFTTPINLNDDGVRGWLNPPSPNDSPFYPSGTFGDFLRANLTKFNAHLKIDGNNLYMLKTGEGVSSAMWNIPDYKIEKFRLNTSDFKANTFIKFQTDLSEANTIDQYKGTSVQITREPLFSNNTQFKLMKGFEEIQIPFALARTKKDLTTPEKIVKGFLVAFDTLVNGLISAVNAVIQVFNQVTKTLNKIMKALDVVGIKIKWEIKPLKTLNKIDLSANIDNRIGMLVLENDFFNVPKNFILNKGAQTKNNKPHANNDFIYSAKNFYDVFHVSNSFVPTAAMPNANQYFIFDFEGITFQKKEFNLVKNNSNVKFTDGSEGFVNTVNWDVDNETANVEVWKNKLYTKNIQEKIIEPT